MIDVKDIHPLTDFQRHTKAHLKRLKETGRPQVLTVNGRAELVVQDAEAYQTLLEAVDRAEALDALRRGLEDVTAGRTRPFADALEDLRRRHDRLRLRRSRRPTSRPSISTFGTTPPPAPLRGAAGLLQAAQALEQFPHRCPLAPESGAALEIRQLLYGRYRVLFTIARDTVYILHIRHSARQPLTAGGTTRPTKSKSG